MKTEDEVKTEGLELMDSNLLRVFRRSFLIPFTSKVLRVGETMSSLYLPLYVD